MAVPRRASAEPRRDTRGIVDASGLFSRVNFRRRLPAPELLRYVESYWLIDWDLPEPYASHVVPHPSVNVVFQQFGTAPRWGEVAGIGLELFTQKLEGRGRVCGVKMRPGGFRPFAPRWPVSEWSGRRVSIGEVLPATDVDAGAVLDAPDEDARVAALDAFLLRMDPRPDASADEAMRLVELAGADRTIRRVSQLASAAGLSVRSLQRLFATYVGVGPKWVILRYRIHEALERAEASGKAEASGGTVSGGAVDGGLDWSALAAELGYSDQAHLVRDFTATVGAPPTAYARTAK